MLTGIYETDIRYPDALTRLYPSITSHTAEPGNTVIPSGRPGAGFGYHSGFGDVVPWNVYPPTMSQIVEAAEAAEIQSRMAAQSAEIERIAGFMGIGLGNYGDDDPALVAARVAETVRRLDDLIVSDYMVSPSVLAHAAVLAAYFGPQYASHPDVVTALARLRTRYDFYTRNYPGTELLWAGSTMPSGSTARPPIVLQYRDGSFAYAPGFGPVAQYGALQVQSSSLPPQPRISAYTGQSVGSASPVDVVAALIPATTPGTPGTTTPPGAQTLNPAPGSKPSTGTSTPAPNSGQPHSTSTLPFGLTPQTALYAGGGLLAVAVLLSLGGRR